MKENFLHLLQSPDIENIELALQLVQGNPEWQAEVKRYEELYEFFFRKYTAFIKAEHIVHINQGTLDISHRGLDHLPKAVLAVDIVKKAIFENNRFWTLPKEIKHWKSLQSLDLTYNQIRQLPEDMLHLQNLKKLQLETNGIRVFPEVICELERLEYLDLHHNQLEKIPDEIGKLKHLTKLSVERNAIDMLPQTLGNLNSLEYLNISSNQLTALPQTFISLQNLKELYLSDNIKFSNKDYEMLKELPKIETLYLNGLKIKKLDKSITQINSLKSLAPLYNKIEKLPQDIGNLKRLKKLILKNNCLNTFPKEIADLHQLEHLGLEHNNIKKLPMDVGFLAKIPLNTIFLYGNPIDKEDVERFKNSLPNCSIYF